MKKALSLILVLVLCLGICACTSKQESKFIGTYEHKYTFSEHYSAYGYNNLVHTISCTEILTLEHDGVGTFKTKATTAGKYYAVGDVVTEGTVKWMVEDGYITIKFSGSRYNKDYGNNKIEPINRTSAYERKAGTLHYASDGMIAYTKIG